MAGYPAYYSELLDDPEMTDFSPVPVTKLVYGGSWAHENGKSMYDYQLRCRPARGRALMLKYTLNGDRARRAGAEMPSVGKLHVIVYGQVKNASNGHDGLEKKSSIRRSPSAV